MEAFDAFVDVEGDSDIAQASREALSAITQSALALEAQRALLPFLWVMSTTAASSKNTPIHALWHHGHLPW